MISRDSADPGRSLAPYRMVAGLVVFALFGITVVSLAHPEPLAMAHNQAFNIAITTAELLVSLGAAYFLVTDFMLYGRLSSFYVGYAFLVFSAASAGSGLLPLILGWGRQMHFVPYGWGLQRAVGATFLFAAALLMDRRVAVVRRRRLVVLGVTLTCALVVSGTIAIYLAKGSSVPQGFQTLLQMASCILLFSASVLFWRAPRSSERSPWFVWISICLTVAGFAELQYAFHPYEPRTAQLGDILRLLFYTGLLLVLGLEWSRGYRRLHWQARELEALHALMTPPNVQDMPAIIRHVVDVVGATLRANVHVDVSGPKANPAEQWAPLDKHLEYPESDNRDTRPVVVAFDGGPNGAPSFGLPLMAGTRRLGMLVVDRGEEGEFGPDDISLMRALAIQASVLLERSMLYEEVAAGAVLQERSRLAREIHDGLAQHLAFLKMRVAWLQRSPSALQLNHLVDIEGVLGTALAEARQAITTLRAAPTGASTAESIAAYALEFGQVSGLDVRAQLDDDVPEVGPRARVELMRIVQEALNNVRKHANARHVNVHVRGRDQGMEVVVRDDGAGFAVEKDFRGHFGIDIMSERAHSIGGRLHVASMPGEGTEVKITVPVAEAEVASRGSQSA